MITHLCIQNFKCLLDVEVDLGPFTILIGPNDSGKSSLLEAIQVLGRTTNEPFSTIALTSAGGAVPLPKLVWKKDIANVLSWVVETSEGIRYELALPTLESPLRERLLVNDSLLLHAQSVPNQSPTAVSLRFELGPKSQSHSIQDQSISALNFSQTQQFASTIPHVREFAVTLRSSTRYQLDPEKLRTVAPSAAEPVLSSSGDNLASVLRAFLAGPDRDAVVEFEKALHRAIPTLKGISIPPVPGQGNANCIEFVLAGSTRPPITIPCTLASDGAMLFTAFLALAYGSSPQILLIEEPENGLHPSRLKMVIDLLRKMSTGEVGNKPRQIIVTTHSPLLLNFVQPEEVRVFRRDVERGTQITPMTAAPNIGKLREEFATGELWYLLGEEALLKGLPA